MKICRKPGVIYDTIFYCVTHFNMDIIKETCMYNIESDSDNDLYYYNLVDNSIVFPNYLYPFFYFNGEKASPLSLFFLLHTDFFKHDFNDFIDCLRNINMLKKHIIDYYFDVNESVKSKLMQKDDGETAILLIDNLDLPKNLKTYLTYVIYNFDSTVEKLIELFNTLKPEVEKIHNDNKKLIDEFKRGIKRNSDIIANYFKVNFTNINNFVSISFMNRYACMKQIHDETGGAAFLLGLNYDTTIKKDLNFAHVTIHSFGRIIGEDSMYRILEILFNQPGLTSSDLARMVNISTSAANRHVIAMREEGIIKISNKTGNNIYYSVNNDYFKYMKNMFGQYFVRFFK